MKTLRLLTQMCVGFNEPFPCCFFFNNTPTENVSEGTVLGIVIDNKLKSKSH